MKIFLYLIVIFITALGLISCGEKKEEDQFPERQEVEYSPTKDADIQKYNLDVMKKQSANRSPCDTISVIEFVLNNYPEGTYVVDFDKTTAYNVPKPAVIYDKDGGNSYVFAVIARSKPGERLIESKNIVGYDQSFIDLDSTKLGTAFFYLTLLECNGSDFNIVWEAPIPSHGGFNRISFEKWNYNQTPYFRINFHYAQGVGHIDYNYFLVNGLTSFPHLLMTYKGINFQRTMTNFNNDKYPDYLEYLFYDIGDKVTVADSIPFYWDVKDSLYINSRNKNQTRPY